MATRKKLNDPKRTKKFFEAKLAFTNGPFDVKEMLDEHEAVNIIDVRAAEDYVEGHIPGAINIPMDQWRSAKGLSKRMTNVLYCYSQTCHLAARAAVFFAGNGFPVVEMEGGFESWKEHDYPVEKAAASKAA